MPRLRASGKVSLLRAHDFKTGYGPDSDKIDVEAVFKLESRPHEAYGFTLRDDDNQIAHRAMFSLLLDAFANDWTVTVVYDIDEGDANGVAMRLWLTRPVQPSFDVDAFDADRVVEAPRSGS